MELFRLPPLANVVGLLPDRVPIGARLVRFGGFIARESPVSDCYLEPLARLNSLSGPDEVRAQVHKLAPLRRMSIMRTRLEHI